MCWGPGGRAGARELGRGPRRAVTLALSRSCGDRASGRRSQWAGSRRFRAATGRLPARRGPFPARTPEPGARDEPACEGRPPPRPRGGLDPAADSSESRTLGIFLHFSLSLYFVSSLRGKSLSLQTSDTDFLLPQFRGAGGARVFISRFPGAVAPVVTATWPPSTAD